jgi:hypothetical protein
MSGLPILSGNLGDSEAACGFKLTNGVAMMRRTAKYRRRDCNERTGGPVFFFRSLA